MREIRQSGSVRGVRRNPYPYRDSLSTKRIQNAKTHWGRFHPSPLTYASGLPIVAPVVTCSYNSCYLRSIRNTNLCQVCSFYTIR